MHDLPFAAGRADLTDALASRGCAVIQAPPGTGKTTLAPQYVLDHLRDAGRTSHGHRIVVTQPRRVAARSAAARIAEVRGTTLGDEVGYTVRGDRKVSADTVIEMVTPGVLLRRLLADPDLPGVDAVVIDEIHERHLESDLVFGMVAQLRELREDLLVVAMSATLDAARFAELLGGDAGPAPLVDVPSPIHPLDIRYADAAQSMAHRDRRNRTAVEDLVTATVRSTLAETTGDVLVFVPTIRGTETVAASLTGDGVAAMALHGRLRPAEQARIVRGHGGGARRVIVATDVAESSLTVPGVRVVVDSCLSRVSRRDTTRGMSVLVTETASQASMTQRAGRAGREGPGTVYRCLTAEQYAKAPAASPPAVLTSDLTAAMLDVACWGSPRGVDLPLPDPFPSAAATVAEDALRAIGAVDASGQVTAEGRRLARIPADPRLAHGGLIASEQVDAATVAKVLAVLDGSVGSVDDLPRNLPSGSDPVVQRFRRLLDDGRDGANGTGRADRADRAGSVGGAGLRGSDAVAYTLACACPGLIAHRVTGSSGDRYLTVSGTGAVWRGGHATGAAGAAGTEWIAVADIAGASTRSTDGAGAVIRAAVPLTEALAFDAAAPLLRDGVVCTWTPGGTAGKLTARRVRTLGAVELASTPVSVKDVPVSAREQAVREGLQSSGLGVLAWSDHAAELRRRIQYLHEQGVEGYPDVADAARASQLLEFVVPELAAERRPDLAGLLRGLIPWNRPVDEAAPTSLELPVGRTVRLRYPEVGTGGPVVVATKLQDCFGLQASPEIAGRRVQFQLLSPAQRPLAVTDDLASFWAGPYAQVRSEMRGRYPKHPWPERP
ncbi:ATP-dependent helicase HrpB [Corynebacterium terpenotabidum]|uniref:ATP-dependent helicase n=1 Tax=Corynebacterium terpenotabidum Y-11 TaxID=1200352 RepID=S4XFA7_9CORY|nr:ATP-dependent helicase HrpB [Corynebacterium terpenotabidum]AGP31817.1 ATP-dependent helicase [Corynebacterium terpenotabidum Y-11]